MRPDYYVPFKSEETIAYIATQWRHYGQLEYNTCFDITEFIVNTLTPLYTKKGELEIILFDQEPKGPPAYVKYNPLRLYVDREIWSEARDGEPMARFILAHEVGHILLHDHHAKSFSANPELRLRFPMNENRSEWQADTLGGYLLISDNDVAIARNEDELAIVHGIPAQLAADRFYASKRRSQTLIYSGDLCSRCGNFTLIRNKTGFNCNNCGLSNLFG